MTLRHTAAGVIQTVCLGAAAWLIHSGDRMYEGVQLLVSALFGTVLLYEGWRKNTHSAFHVRLFVLYQGFMVLQIYLAVSGTGTAAMLPSIPHASTPAFIGSFKKGPAAAAGRAGQRVGEERDAFEGGFYKKSAHTFNIKAGAPGANTANDVRTYTRDEVRAGARQLFDELGDEGFQDGLKNPCWNAKAESGGRDGYKKGDFVCLPYAYLLGLPKCGTSDLWTRVGKHPELVQTKRKEIRWFTRGEFSHTRAPTGGFVGPETSLATFTMHFNRVAEMLSRGEKDDTHHPIAIDGGPHTLWWGLQAPDGSAGDGVPIPQLLHEMQPDAKLIITLTDPVARMYSDYYFLTDHGVTLNDPEGLSDKSPLEFEAIVRQQVTAFEECLESFGGPESARLDMAVGVKGAEVLTEGAARCAYDRDAFGRPGSGRMATGLYAVYLERWLAAGFPLESVLVLRLEDFNKDPQAHMQRVFTHLDMGTPDAGEWERIVGDANRENTFPHKRPDMTDEGEALLRSFYQPYNDALAALLGDARFTWRDTGHVDLTREERGRGGPRGRAAKPGIPRGFNKFNPNAAKDLESGGGGPDGGGGAPNGLGPRFDPVAGGEGDKRAAYIQGRDAGEDLCTLALSLEPELLTELLSRKGVDVNAQDRNGRTALHCAQLIFLFGDSMRSSYLFALLSGKPSWLDQVVTKRPADMSTFGMPDILNATMHGVAVVTSLLLEAGANPVVVDKIGRTPLHYAAQGGFEESAALLVRASPAAQAMDVTDTMNRQTPLHLTGIFGHAAVARVLVSGGSNAMDTPDQHGNSPRDLFMSAGGAILPDDALHYLGLVQTPPKKLPRANSTYARYGNGGWDESRGNLLEPWLTSERCDVDMLDASEFSAELFVKEYIARNRPVLIRGLMDDAPGWGHFTREALLRKHGGKQVTVSAIPYHTKFGSPDGTRMTFGQYLADMKKGKIDGGKYPWYVFKGHPVPQGFGKPDSMVSPEEAPVPQVIQDGFNLAAQAAVSFERSKTAKSAKPKGIEVFVNYQFAVGMVGSGAPVHFHNTAWNQVFYGAKRWFAQPPHYNMMGKMQILKWVDEERQPMLARGWKGAECVQRSGDVIVIPELWGHGVLNLGDTVAVATEGRGSMYRVQPLPRAFEIHSPQSFRRPPLGGLAGRGGGGGERGGGGGERGRQAPPRPPRDQQRLGLDSPQRAAREAMDKRFRDARGGGGQG